MTNHLVRSRANLIGAGHLRRPTATRLAAAASPCLRTTILTVIRIGNASFSLCDLFVSFVVSCYLFVTDYLGYTIELINHVAVRIDVVLCSTLSSSFRSWFCFKIVSFFIVCSIGA